MRMGTVWRRGVGARWRGCRWCGSRQRGTVHDASLLAPQPDAHEHDRRRGGACDAPVTPRQVSAVCIHGGESQFAMKRYLHGRPGRLEVEAHEGCRTQVQRT
mmetsp:Transcript_21612/g.53343  ORF Transcript_21612/g.53343 Transcript_21612/m.53343 type:complete len:102 (-) Transcript_21612:107-412(-)